MVLVGVGTFFAQATATGFVSRAATTDRGAASGIYLASYFFGGLVGSAVLGQVFDRFGWPASVAGIGRRSPSPPFWVSICGAHLSRIVENDIRQGGVSNMPKTFDAIIIGSGQAGPSLAVRLAQAGMKTALIEREHLGGTCVNDGCIPTKTLVASARVAHLARRAAEYGVPIGGEVSGRYEGREGAQGQDRSGVARQSGKLDRRHGEPDADLGRGPLHRCPYGRGGRRKPDGTPDLHQYRRASDRPGLARAVDEVPFLTNTSMMALDTLPDHLIVAGGSYIGLEFAQMYRRFGSGVTVVEQPTG